MTDTLELERIHQGFSECALRSGPVILRHSEDAQLQDIMDRSDPGQVPDGYQAALEDYALSLGYVVTYEDQPLNDEQQVHGFTDHTPRLFDQPGQIVIDSSASPARQFATLVHELVHAWLWNVVPMEQRLDGSNTLLEEIMAESVSGIVAGKLRCYDSGFSLRYLRRHCARIVLVPELLEEMRPMAVQIAGEILEAVGA
jgi:hypothetical protein